MSDNSFVYKKIADDFEQFLKSNKDDFCHDEKCDTREVTETIKKFFGEYFSKSFKVFTSNNANEFLYDITVMNCSPKEILSDSAVIPHIYLVAESELGGSGANSSKALLQNLSEDFFKILQSSAEFRIFIGINDAENITERIQLFQTAYEKMNQKNPILLILIKGERNKDVKGNQIQIDSKLSISNCILS